MWEKMETKTIVYDLDTSGGLMEVRVALLIPFPQRREGTSALRPTKPVLSSQRKWAGGGGGFFPPRLSHLCNLRGPSSASEDVCSSFTSRRPRFALPRHQPTPSRCTGGLPHPLLVGPFVLPPARPGTRLQASPEPSLESPTVHTRKWRAGNRAPSPHPPTLILPIWKKLFSLLCCRNTVRVGSPWFRGLRGSGSSLDGRKKDKRGERGG